MSLSVIVDYTKFGQGLEGCKQTRRQRNVYKLYIWKKKVGSVLIYSSSIFYVDTRLYSPATVARQGKMKYQLQSRTQIDSLKNGVCFTFLLSISFKQKSRLGQKVPHAFHSKTMFLKHCLQISRDSLNSYLTGQLFSILKFPRFFPIDRRPVTVSFIS